MPRVHRVASLLKRWLLGTHQGGVAYYYLPYYLDEFTFRFNRRKSASRGKLFFRLMQQAVATSPRTHESMVRSAQPKPLSIGAGCVKRISNLACVGFKPMMPVFTSI